MKQMMAVQFKYLLILAVLMQPAMSWAEQTKRVLMVVSGYGEQKGEVKPGFEFDEFAKAYLVFSENNLHIDVASPKGGPVEADNYDPAKPYNANILADNVAMAKINNTLAIDSLTAQDYDAVFVVGGKGAMFDLPKDAALQKMIASIYEQRGIVAAVCHGPAALVDVKLGNGEYLIAGKAVNGFTNKEEKLFGKKWVKTFDFLLEDKLIERGGHFQSSDIMLNHVAQDGRLITGQNPSSTIAVATQLVESLGLAPKPMEAFQDDATLALVADILDGDLAAIDTIKQSPDSYHMPLVGMYGYYYVAGAQAETDLKNALLLMNLARDAINNPHLDMQIAKVHKKLGDTPSAVAMLNTILASKPEFQPALDMLNGLAN